MIIIYQKNCIIFFSRPDEILTEGAKTFDSLQTILVEVQDYLHVVQNSSNVSLSLSLSFSLSLSLSL